MPSTAAPFESMSQRVLKVAFLSWDMLPLVGVLMSACPGDTAGLEGAELVVERVLQKERDDGRGPKHVSRVDSTQSMYCQSRTAGNELK